MDTLTTVSAFITDKSLDSIGILLLVLKAIVDIIRRRT